MTILKTDTVSGIGTEGTVFEGDITFDSLNYMTLPKGTTTQSNRGRGVVGGGGPYLAHMSYVQIQSQGNLIDFGDMTQALRGPGGTSSAERGVIGGGLGPSSNVGVNVIQYITISTTSNATDFGDLTRSEFMITGVSNGSRGVFGGGYGVPAGHQNTMDYISIATEGRAIDFGNLSESRDHLAGCSNAHGGL